MPSGQGTNRQADEAAIEEMRRTLEVARSHQLNPPLPNFSAGPGLPHPLGLNFYSVNWHYPAYLLCEYSVSENHYDQSNEPAWFDAALLQIRATGRDRFASSLKWVAVAIHNRAERTYEEGYRVAAIFELSEVFDISRDLARLITQTKLDRHPVIHDPKQLTPGEQQRWLIVERHAARNRTSDGSN